MAIPYPVKLAYYCAKSFLGCTCVWPLRLLQMGDRRWEHYAIAMLPRLLWVNLGPLRSFVGARVSQVPGLLRIELPGPEVFFEPLPNDPTRVRAALWEFLSAHWFEVDLLDEYNTHRLLRPGMVVLDVGANVGTFAAVASRRVGSGGRVISVEPVTTNLECLSRTIEANGLANVEVLERAIGDENGTLEIFVSPTYSGRHSAVIKAGKPHSVRVRQSTVDALVAELRLEAVDFLKIDIEGYEVHALRGAVETIKRFRPIVAIAAYHDRAHPETLSALMTESAQDYDVFLRRSPPLFPFVKCFGIPRERRV